MFPCKEDLKNNCGLRKIIAIWVDDLMAIAKEKQHADEFLLKMSSLFDMTDEGECTFYLGMNVEQKETGILIHQRKYLETALEHFGLHNLPLKNVPMNPDVILETEKEIILTLPTFAVPIKIPIVTFPS
jgi:hypothetical protein